MSIDTKQVLENALSLPAIDRIALVESLLKSLDQPDPTIDAIWAEEAEQRLAEFYSGRMRAIPADEVFQEFGDL